MSTSSGGIASNNKHYEDASSIDLAETVEEESVDAATTDLPMQPVVIEAEKVPSIVESIRSTGRSWRVRMLARMRRQKMRSTSTAQDTSATRSVVSLSMHASYAMDAAQRWLGRTRKQRLIRFAVFTLILLAILFVTNAILVGLGLWSLARMPSNAFLPTRIDVSGLCDEWLRVHFSGELNGGSLMWAYEVVFDEPLVVDLAVELPPGIRKTDEPVHLATVRVPPFRIGRHRRRQLLDMPDIKVRLNADYPFGPLGKRLVEHFRDLPPSQRPVIAVRAKIVLGTVETSSLWFPLRINGAGHEHRQEIDLTPFLRPPPSAPAADKIDWRSHTDLASLEFLPEVDSQRIDLMTRLQYPKALIPKAVHLSLPPLQFDIKSKSLLPSDPFFPFATVITHAHVLQADEHAIPQEGYFVVQASLSTDRLDPLVRFLEHIRDGERGFLVSVAGADVPAAAPLLPVCDRCVLQRIIKSFEIDIPFADFGISEPLPTIDFNKLAALTNDLETNSGRNDIRNDGRNDDRNNSRNDGRSDSKDPPPNSVIPNNGNDDAKNIPNDSDAHRSALLQSVKKEREALSVGLVGLDPETSSFQIELHIAIAFLERLFHFNYHKLKGQLPTLFIRNVLTYTSSSRRQSTLAALSIRHIAGRSDGTATTFDFLITVTMSDMTKFVKIAHKLHQMEHVSYEELMRELLELKSVLVTGSSKNLLSRILSVFEVELPLERDGRAGFRRNGSSESPLAAPSEGQSPPGGGFSFFRDDYDRLRDFVKHAVDLHVRSSITSVEVTGHVQFNDQPAVTAPRVRVFWEPVSVSLFPVATRPGDAHLANVELLHVEVRRGSFWLSLAAQHPLTLFHSGHIAFAGSMHSDDLDADSPTGLIAAWEYLIGLWYREPQFTRFLLAGTIGRKGKIKMEGCLPPRSGLLRLSPKNRWEHSPAQASLSDLISSLIQTQLKIVGFSDATLKMLFELPSFGRCTIPTKAGIVPVVSLHVSMPKISMNVCQSRPAAEDDDSAASGAPESPREEQRDNAWWRRNKRHPPSSNANEGRGLGGKRPRCMVQVSLQPVHLSVDFVAGGFCDVRARLRRDSEYARSGLSHATTDELDDEDRHPQALFSKHHQHRKDRTTLFVDDKRRIRSNRGRASHLHQHGHVPENGDPADAIFEEHHDHYQSGSPSSPATGRGGSNHSSSGDFDEPPSLKNLLPLSLAIISLEDLISAYQDITSRDLWQLRISLGLLPPSDATAASPAETAQASDILLINRFINRIGAMFPVEFPMVMPNKSDRPPVPDLYEDEPLEVSVNVQSDDPQKMRGTVQMSFPRATLHHYHHAGGSRFTEDERELEEQSASLNFLLTVQWGDTFIHLRHGNSYVCLRLAQGQIQMRLANERLRINPRLLPFFSRHLIADFRVFVDDRDFDSTRLRTLLSLLRGAFEASAASAAAAGHGTPTMSSLAEERVGREELALTVVVGKYDPTLEDSGKAKDHHRHVRRQFFEETTPPLLNVNNIDRYRLTSTVQIATILRLACLTHNRYRSGMPATSSSMIVAEQMQEQIIPRYAAVIGVRPESTQPQLVHLPCIMPRMCKPGWMETGPQELRFVTTGTLRVHHMLQRVANKAAAVVARAIHKLNLRQYPQDVRFRVRTSLIGLNIAINGIDALEAYMETGIDISRNAILPYPGHSVENALNPLIDNVARDSELFIARVYLPHHAHYIPALLAPVAFDQLGRLDLGRVPPFRYRRHDRPLLHTPMHAALTNEHTKHKNLLSSLCGLMPEVLLGSIPAHHGSNGFTLTFESATDKLVIVRLHNVTIPNPSAHFTVEIAEQIVVYYAYAGYPFVRVELRAPFTLLPGPNRMDVLVKVSRSAFDKLDVRENRSQRIFNEFLDGFFFGRPLSIDMLIDIGPHIHFRMPVHFAAHPMKLGPYDITGSNPIQINVEGALAEAKSAIWTRAGQFDLGKTVRGGLSSVGDYIAGFFEASGEDYPKSSAGDGSRRVKRERRSVPMDDDYQLFKSSLVRSDAGSSEDEADRLVQRWAFDREMRSMYAESVVTKHTSNFSVKLIESSSVVDDAESDGGHKGDKEPGKELDKDDEASNKQPPSMWTRITLILVRLKSASSLSRGWRAWTQSTASPPKVDDSAPKPSSWFDCFSRFRGRKEGAASLAASSNARDAKSSEGGEGFVKRWLWNRPSAGTMPRTMHSVVLDPVASEQDGGEEVATSWLSRCFSRKKRQQKHAAEPVPGTRPAKSTTEASSGGLLSWLGSFLTTSKTTAAPATTEYKEAKPPKETTADSGPRLRRRSHSAGRTKKASKKAKSGWIQSVFNFIWPNNDSDESQTDEAEAPRPQSPDGSTFQEEPASTRPLALHPQVQGNHSKAGDQSSDDEDREFHDAHSIPASSPSSSSSSSKSSSGRRSEGNGPLVILDEDMPERPVLKDTTKSSRWSVPNPLKIILWLLPSRQQSPNKPKKDALAKKGAARSSLDVELHADLEPESMIAAILSGGEDTFEEDEPIASRKLALYSRGQSDHSKAGDQSSDSEDREFHDAHTIPASSPSSLSSSSKSSSSRSSKGNGPLVISDEDMQDRPVPKDIAKSSRWSAFNPLKIIRWLLPSRQQSPKKPKKDALAKKVATPSPSSHADLGSQNMIAAILSDGETALVGIEGTALEPAQTVEIEEVSEDEVDASHSVEVEHGQDEGLKSPSFGAGAGKGKPIEVPASSSDSDQFSRTPIKKERTRKSVSAGRSRKRVHFSGMSTRSSRTPSPDGMPPIPTEGLPPKRDKASDDTAKHGGSKQSRSFEADTHRSDHGKEKDRPTEPGSDAPVSKGSSNFKGLWSTIINMAIGKLNDAISKIPSRYQIHNPLGYKIHVLALAPNLLVSDPTGPSYGLRSVKKGFSMSRRALLTGDVCQSVCRRKLLATDPPAFCPADLVKKTDSRDEGSDDKPLFEDATLGLIQCVHEQLQEPILSFSSSAKASSHKLLNFSVTSFSKRDLASLFAKARYSDGLCVHAHGVAISAVLEGAGHTVFTDAVVNVPNQAIAFSPFTDPCRLQGACHPSYLPEGIGRVWHSRTRSDPHYMPPATSALVTQPHERQQMWRVRPVSAHVSWHARFDFALSKLEKGPNAGPTHPARSPGLAFVIRSFRHAHPSQGMGAHVTCDGSFGYLGTPYSTAIVLDFSRSSVSWVLNGDAHTRFEKRRGGLWKMQANNAWQSVSIRYDAGVQRLLVDITDPGGISYHSLFRSVRLAEIIGDKEAFVGLTAASEQFAGVQIRNWSMQLVAPDLQNTRVHYLEGYSPRPGQVGFFVLQLADACDERLLRAPRRLLVRLKRHTLLKAWIGDIYGLPNTPKPSALPSRGAPISQEQTPSLTSNPLYVPVSIELLVEQGLYRASYTAPLQGRYEIELALAPPALSSGTPNGDPPSDSGVSVVSPEEADYYEWKSIPYQYVYVRYPQ